jgi:hypothetical protein
MNTPTYFRKFGLLSQPWRAFFALFTILVGMGASQSAFGQTFGARRATIFVNQSGTSSTTDYNVETNVATGATPPAGLFDERNFGTFDLANTNDKLNLTNGSFTITEPANTTYTQGFIDYRVFVGTTASGTATPTTAATGTLQLTDQGATGGVRTFSSATAIRDILAAVTTGGAGTTYRFDLTYRAEGTVATVNEDGETVNTPITTTSAGLTRRSQFTAINARVTPTPPGVTGPTGFTLYVDKTNTGNGPDTVYPAASFDNASLGTFDINSGKLLLNGGTFTTTEAPDATYDYAVTNAFIGYSVNKAGVGPTQYTTLELTQTAYDPATGRRTFTLTQAQQNLIRQAAITAASGGGGAAPGTKYEVAVQARVSYDRTERSTGTVRNITVRDDNMGAQYVANFFVTGTIVQPTNLNTTNVFISPNNPTPNTTYGASSGTTPLFNGANLGTYDVNAGRLFLNGGSAIAFVNGTDQVSNVRLNYRVYKSGQTPGAFSSLALTTGTTSNGNTTYSLSNALVNLVTTVVPGSGIGTFNVQVFYDADVTRANGSIGTLRDDNNSNFYTAQFTLNGNPVVTETWTGAINDDWFNAGNWDLGFIPTQMTNVIVPDFGGGTLRPYPNIYAGTTFVASNGVLTNNSASGPALVRNLTLNGSTQAQRTILRLQGGRLRVFGDFSNLQDSYIQRENTVFELAGINQAISGGSNFDQVEVSGGGTKTLTGSMVVLTSFTFTSPNTIFATDISKPTVNYIEFGDRTPSNPNGAQLIGETNTSYIRGFARTTRSDVRANERKPDGSPDPRTFSNLGVTLFFTGSVNPGTTLITRNTAESYTPLINNGGGETARYGIRRIFGIRPGTTAGVKANMTFAYLENELVNLGPDGKGSVSEPNLGLFISTSSGNVFGGLGVDALDQVNNVLTKYEVKQFATFTLGDVTRPLPVVLTGFDAKRMGAETLLTWETASEKNSKGFFVEVSNDGKAFRSLGFVESATANTAQPQSYRFVDAEANKTGNRYYRLRQIDLDDKTTTSPVRVVNFGGAAVVTSASLSAFPNPFTTDLSVAVAGAGTGAATLRLTDLTGRTIRTQKVSLEGGSGIVPLNNLGSLNAGIYIVQLTLPSGKTQNFKVQKQ